MAGGDSGIDALIVADGGETFDGGCSGLFDGSSHKLSMSIGAAGRVMGAAGAGIVIDVPVLADSTKGLALVSGMPGANRIDDPREANLVASSVPSTTNRTLQSTSGGRFV